MKLPVRRLTPEDVGARLPEGSGESIPYNAVAGAVLALRRGERPQNLLSFGRHPRPRRPLLLTGVLAFIIVVMVAMYCLMPLYFEGRRLLEMDRQIAARKDMARRIEALRNANERQKAEIEAIRGFRRNGLRSLAMMKEVCMLLPKTAWLTRLKASDASVDMEGYAKSAAEVLQRLRSSKTFQKADLTSPPTKDMALDRERFVMKIKMEDSRNNGAEQRKVGQKRK